MTTTIKADQSHTYKCQKSKQSISRVYQDLQTYSRSALERLNNPSNRGEVERGFSYKQSQSWLNILRQRSVLDPTNKLFCFHDKPKWKQCKQCRRGQTYADYMWSLLKAEVKSNLQLTDEQAEQLRRL